MNTTHAPLHAMHDRDCSLLPTVLPREGSGAIVIRDRMASALAALAGP